MHLRGIHLAAFLAAVACSGCGSPPKLVVERVRLEEWDAPPFHMTDRNDLIEVSDCQIDFDLSSVPEDAGIPLVKYDPFDSNSSGLAKTAICPLRAVLAEVLRDGASRVFFCGEDRSGTTVKIVPVEIGISKTGPGIRCVISCHAEMSGERIATLKAERTSSWDETSKVPESVYEVAVLLGDALFDAIAHNRKCLDVMIAENHGVGTRPTAKEWVFGKTEGYSTSGTVVVDTGTWDMVRVHKWIRSQIEQAVCVKLGIKSAEKVRILIDGGQSGGTSVAFSFRVFPYRGFELSYDSRTRLGRCVADLAFLDVGEPEAYEMAVRFIETIVSDQGVVKTPGKPSAPAQYRFNGYRSTENGTKIEIPFELVN